MADYKRFVSYIYQYEKGVKGPNMGYARVESRSGACRVAIHVRGMFVGQNENCKIYGLVRRGNKLVGVYLGLAMPKNGIMEYKINTPTNNIAGSIYSFTQIIGIYLDTDREKVYATGWDDIPIQLSQFTLIDEQEELVHAAEIEKKKYDVEVENLTREESVEEVVEAVVKVEETEELSSVEVDSAEDKEHEEIQEIRSAKIDTEETVTEEITTEDIAAEEIDTEQFETGETPNHAVNISVSSQTNTIVEDNHLHDKKVMDKMSNDNSIPGLQEEEMLDYKEFLKYMEEKKRRSAAPQDNVSNTEFIPPNSIHSVQREERRPLSNTQSSASAMNMREHQGTNANDTSERQMEPQDKWDRLCRLYKRIRPFQDNEVIDCIQIEPKDLVHLQKEEWVLGNNSFLLHGYYNYRYLIMGKMERDNKIVFILGVPGVFENQEKFMANMFGFSNFKPADRAETKTGEFGYWYRIVR